MDKKRGEKIKPIFTIITVVYNDVKNIEKTLKSVFGQTCKDFEYIVIDGKSEDGTVDVIKKYEKYIDYWVSEKDKGIYDAMNKGIKMAKGKYINFLNSGDIFHKETVLEDVRTILNQTEPEIFSGRSLFIYNDYEVCNPIFRGGLKFGIRPSHQACFVKREILQNLDYFDLQYRACSDFDFFCKYFKLGGHIESHNIVVTDYLTGGFSSRKEITYSESYDIIKKYFGNYYAYRFYFLKIILEQGSKKLLMKLGMQELLSKLIKINNRKGVV